MPNTSGICFLDLSRRLLSFLGRDYSTFFTRDKLRYVLFDMFLRNALLRKYRLGLKPLPLELAASFPLLATLLQHATKADVSESSKQYVCTFLCLRHFCTPVLCPLLEWIGYHGKPIGRH